MLFRSCPMASVDDILEALIALGRIRSTPREVELASLVIRSMELAQRQLATRVLQTVNNGHVADPANLLPVMTDICVDCGNVISRPPSAASQPNISDHNNVTHYSDISD